VRFLELSRVGRTLADGTDEESAYAAGVDTWIAWETEDVVEVERLTPGVTARPPSRFLLVLLSFLSFCKGVLRSPMTCAQRTCGG
jgi:hypothetical protein